MAAPPVRSFEVEQHLAAQREEPHSQQHALNGLEPPPPPQRSTVFKVTLRKHAFVARKRKRLLTCVWPAIIYSLIEAAIYYALSSIEDKSLKGTLFAILGPLYLCFALTSCMQCVIVEIVSEKESKMKIVQQIYGLTPFMYWLTWVGYFSIVSAVAIAAILAILTLVAPVIGNANLLLVLVIFAAAYVQQFEFASIAAVFFDKVTTATTLANVLTFLTTFLAASMQGFLRGKTRLVWYLAGFLPTVSFYNGFATTLWLESYYACDEKSCAPLGLSLETLWASELCPVRKAPCPVQQVSVFPAGDSIVLLFMNVALYGFLSWWLDNVWQGEYGSAKPWNFCLQASFVCPRREAVAVQPLGQDADGRTVTMSIHALRKTFGDKVAVDDVSLHFHSSEIFALLGHNGAGKTTAINCVVGLIPPTSGEASVNGFDVRTDVEGVRRQLSLCPQDNPVYDVFTVRQHLTFFASLRGVPEADIADRIDEVLAALGIPEKIDDLCTVLSGGQKRRLWVATALVGQTPVVFLDEPTSGMDPSSRRELWNLLLQMRTTGRTIIFTTHYLEEADVLADRKAVLARGRVQAVGTSQDLKRDFGIGYHLNLVLQPSASDESRARLHELVMQHVPTAKTSPLEAEPGAASDSIAQFVLPYQSVDQIGPLLQRIDEQTSELHVQHYSLPMSSLEEVFMKLGEQAEARAGGGVAANADFRDIEQEPDETAGRPETSELRSLQAVARMRIDTLIGDTKNIYNSVLLPCVLVVIAFVFNNDSGYNIAIYPPTAFGIATIFFTVHVIKDRQFKCKHTAIAQGLSSSAYWLGTAAANFATLLPVTLTLAAMVVLKTPAGLADTTLPMIFVETFVYPVGLLLYAYNFSMMFDTVEVAMKVIPLCNIFLGMIPAIVVMVLLQLPDADLIELARIIHIVMSFTNPLYGMPGMLVCLMQTPDQGVIGSFDTYAAVPLYAAVVMFPLMAMHLVYTDRRSRTARPGPVREEGSEGKDDDVLAEERRVREAVDAEGEVVRYVNLMHTYKTKVNGKWTETPAVRGISLGIQSGECFGLLGPNGAGKTTTLAALTAEVRPPSSGRLLVCGQDVADPAGLEAAYRLLGVCPQVDPLWGRLTGRQHLLFYGRVKGVPEEELEQTTQRILYRLGFDAADAQKKADDYSGGMKRKLSLAIALIGHSDLLFLDEPSAAVDAAAKRHLWKVIKRRRRGQSVVLTTHSMEEAEALCGRIAIQVKGQLRCLGSPMHIKHKYGSGYQLEIFSRAYSTGSFVGQDRVDAAMVEDPIIRFVRSRLTPQATLIERHAGRYLFQLPPMSPGGNLSLGQVFIEMSQNRKSMGITDFSINQPSLEQVFIRFAREQDEADQPEPVPEGPQNATLPADVGETRNRTPLLQS